MDKVNKLRRIWDDIPTAVNEQLDLSQKEIINHYMGVFHFGEYFYVIFNTRTTEMEYVSPNVEQVLGYTPEEFRFQFLLDNIHPADLPYYYHYEQSAVRFFSGLAPDLFFKYKFAYDYRIKIKDNNYKRMQQQVVPLYYFQEGGVRTLAIFTDLTHFNMQGIPKLSFIGMQGAPSYYNVHLKDEFLLSLNIFTKKEFEILQYIVQGLKSEDIAKQLKRSVFTVRNHRKNILYKSGCNNVQELFVKSIREGWV